MPLKLVPPRAGKSPNWSIRGSYLRIHVDKSSGSPRRAVARQQLERIERAIEQGEWPPQPSHADRPEPTFLSAAVGYFEAGRSRDYVARLIAHFGETPLAAIDQAAVAAAAAALHPGRTPATHNRCVYTPVSAILRHAGVDLQLARPKGAKGRVVADWLTPEDAAAIITAAATIDAELALLLRYLLYTGLRLGEALLLDRDDLHLAEGIAWARRGKGQATSAIRLRTDLVAALTAHLASHDRRRVFRFHQGGGLKHLLTRAKLAALGLPCPARRPTGWRAPPHRLAWVRFHTLRHTWATWMRRYAGADVQGLVATGNWRDPRSAARYSHAVAHDEWARVDELPDLGVAAAPQRKTGA